MAAGGASGLNIRAQESNTEEAASGGRTQDAAAISAGTSAFGPSLRPHVERHLGAGGLRLVRLYALVDGGASHAFRIAHAWHVADGECASLFTVLAPGPLAHTTVLLRERPFETFPRLWVQLASARQPVRLGRGDIEASVLGTDFSYDDLRTWTPRYVTAARSAVVDGDEHVVLTAEWLYRQRTPVGAVGRIGPHGVPVQAVWTSGPAAEPFRILSAEGIEEIDGVSMPEAVTVRRPVEGYTSRMELDAVRVGRLVEPGLFEPAALLAARDALHELPGSL
jgi:hypothetical protein